MICFSKYGKSNFVLIRKGIQYDCIRYFGLQKKSFLRRLQSKNIKKKGQILGNKNKSPELNQFINQKLQKLNPQTPPPFSHYFQKIPSKFDAGQKQKTQFLGSKGGSKKNALKFESAPYHSKLNLLINNVENAPNPTGFKIKLPASIAPKISGTEIQTDMIEIPQDQKSLKKGIRKDYLAEINDLRMIRHNEIYLPAECKVYELIVAIQDSKTEKCKHMYSHLFFNLFYTKPKNDGIVVSPKLDQKLYDKIKEKNPELYTYFREIKSSESDYDYFNNIWRLAEFLLSYFPIEVLNKIDLYKLNLDQLMIMISSKNFVEQSHPHRIIEALGFLRRSNNSKYTEFTQHRYLNFPNEKVLQIEGEPNRYEKRLEKKMAHDNYLIQKQNMDKAIHYKTHFKLNKIRVYEQPQILRAIDHLLQHIKKHGLSIISPSYLSSLMVSLSKMGIDDSEMWYTLSQTAVDNLYKLNLRCIANILHSLHLVQMKKGKEVSFGNLFRAAEPILLLKLEHGDLGQLEEGASSIDGQTLSNIYISYTKTQEGSLEFVQGLNTCIINNKDRLTAVDLAIICYSAVRHPLSDSSSNSVCLENSGANTLLEELKAEVMKTIWKLKPREVCNILEAYHIAGQMDVELLKCFENKFVVAHEFYKATDVSELFKLYRHYTITEEMLNKFRKQYLGVTEKEEEEVNSGIVTISESPLFVVSDKFKNKIQKCLHFHMDKYSSQDVVKLFYRMMSTLPPKNVLKTDSEELKKKRNRNIQKGLFLPRDIENKAIKRVYDLIISAKLEYRDAFIIYHEVKNLVNFKDTHYHNKYTKLAERLNQYLNRNKFKI